MLDKHMLPDRGKLKTAWKEFITNGRFQEGVIRPEIIESWVRCRQYGLDPLSASIQAGFSEEKKREILDKNHFLIKVAHPFLQGLFDLIKSMDMVVFLTDQEGFILDALGEGAIWEYCQSKNAVVGSSFHERYSGTNAPIMAIHLNQPYQMVAEEHYMEPIHLATCAAAPIHDEFGRIIACLDITSSYETSLKHPHTLGMIVAGAQVIENQLRLAKELERSYLISQYLKAAMEAMTTGLVILDGHQHITHLNPAAERILGVSYSTVSNRAVDSIMKNETILGALKNHQELMDQEIILKESLNKSRCLATLRPISNLDGQRMGSVLLIKELRVVQKLMQKVAGLSAQYQLADIWGESLAIRETLRLAQLVAKSHSNVVIVGESGTGKEMLAQGIHNAGDFAQGPFLGVNCAAIPHELIESELFGYEAGTFTGGLRSGKSGKLELANGGTLFLDEVNGMSLDMQAKLLRVLEEKRFQRLGGKEYIRLESRIIAATNKDLLEEIENDNFRSDLYFRLNVLEIRIPPLRERRGDVQILTRLFLTEMSRRLGKSLIYLTPEALAYLENQSWPGNVRQLKNWIERAVNLSEGPLLTLADFPETNRMTKPKIAMATKAAVNGRSASLALAEKELVLAALEDCGGNVSEASKRLGIARATIYRKMKKHNLALAKSVAH